MEFVTKTKTAWSEEKTLQLIREFRKRPLLWDQTNIFYFRKVKKLDAWNEIGAAVQEDPELCKHKINILMSAFRREKSKIYKGQSGDKNYRSNWFAFKEMCFLLSKVEKGLEQYCARETTLEYDEPVPQNNGSAKRRLEKEPQRNKNVEIEIPGPHILNTNESILPLPLFDFEQPTSSKILKTDSQQVSQLKSTPESDEEIKAFTNFIMSKMKKYSDTTKNEVQQAICKIIFKADQNGYENSNQKSTSAIDNNIQLDSAYDNDCVNVFDAIKTEESSDSETENV